jgi:putative cell wall-binding protein
MVPARSRRLSRPLSFLLAASLAFSAVPAVVPVPVGAISTQITGTVREPGSAAVAGAHVFAFAVGSYPWAAAQAVTDGSGAYALELPSGGTYQIAAAEPKHLGAFRGGSSVGAARHVASAAGATVAGQDVTLTPKPFRPVTAAPKDFGTSTKQRLRLKGQVRVAGNHALWNDVREVVLRDGLTSGTPSESVLASGGQEPVDLGSKYAFVGAERIDLATRETTQFSAETPSDVSCDDTSVAMVSFSADDFMGTRSLLRVYDVASGAVSFTATITAEDAVELSPGCVANGRVAVVSRNFTSPSHVLVYDIASGQKVRDVTIPTTLIGPTSAVLAGNRLVWTDGSTLRAKDLGTNAATATLETVTAPRVIGSLRAAGDRVMTWEGAGGSSDLAGNETFTANAVLVRDFSDSSVTTAFADAASLPALDGAYDLSAEHALWVQKPSSSANADTVGGSQVMGEEIWGTLAGDPAQRIDTPRFRRGDQTAPLAAGGRVAWSDDSAYPAGVDKTDLFIAPVSGSATPTLVDTDIAGGSVALTPSLLAYSKSVVDADLGMRTDLWIYDTTTHAKRRLVTDVDFGVAATGTWVVYAVMNWNSGGYTLKALDTRTGLARTVYALSGVSDWSESYAASDGKVCYFDNANVAWVYDLGTTRRTRLAVKSGLDGGGGAFDGSHLVSRRDLDFGLSDDLQGTSLHDTLQMLNVSTGEDFALDPLELTSMTALSGDLLLSGNQVQDIQTGDYYQLPLPEASLNEAAIDGKTVVVETQDASDWTTTRLATIDLTADITRDAQRLFGGTRYDTAVALSQDVTSAPAVVIATGRDFPDALAGVPLAQALHAPVLLTQPTELPASVAAEVKRLGATTAYVLGSTSAVSSAVEGQLKTQGHVTSVVRLQGSNRFETAKAVALKLQQVLGGGPVPIAFVATGRNFPDALAASAVAARMHAPILLTDAGSEPQATRDALASLATSETFVLGGPSVVATQTMSGLPNATRLAGADRFETAAAVVGLGMSRGVIDGHGAVCAIGNDFPDALGAGGRAGRDGVPLLLVNRATPAVLPATVDAFFAAHKADRTMPIYIAGGEPALPLQLGRVIAAAIR